METSYSERFEEIIFEEHLSTRAFELSISKTNGWLNMMKKRNGAPGVDAVVKTIEVYPKYNLQWLATGQGEKYAPEEENNLVNEKSEDYKVNEALDEKLDTVIKQNSEILDKLNRPVAKDLIKMAKAMLKEEKNES